MLYNKQEIGKLDKRITFQEKIVGVNVSNEDEESGWQDIATIPTVWAQVDETSGGEVYQANKLNDWKMVNFIIRHRSDINVELRILYQGVKYEIKSILNASRKGFTKIVAESGGEFQEI